LGEMSRRDRGVASAKDKFNRTTKKRPSQNNN